MIEDLETYDSGKSFFGSPAGDLFDTKRDFYRLISLLLTDLGMVCAIRPPSPWQVISLLQNFSESTSASLKVCLSIANEIRLKTYFANGGQKELFSPLLQSQDTTEQSTDDPIFRHIDEDTLVCLLTTSTELHRRCRKICKYIQQNAVVQQDEVGQQDEVVQQDEVQQHEVGILRNPLFHSEAIVRCTAYFRLKNFDRALESLKYIPEDSPQYAFVPSVEDVFTNTRENGKNPLNILKPR